MDSLVRGDITSVAMQGDFGKPRPALVIQTDLFSDHSTVTVVPLTSTLTDAPLLRITVEPNSINGLRKISQLMIDKTTTVQRSSLGSAFGKIDPVHMLELERNLAVFLGIAK